MVRVSGYRPLLDLHRSGADGVIRKKRSGCGQHAAGPSSSPVVAALGGACRSGGGGTGAGSTSAPRLRWSAATLAAARSRARRARSAAVMKRDIMRRPLFLRRRNNPAARSTRWHAGAPWHGGGGPRTPPQPGRDRARRGPSRGVDRLIRITHGMSLLSGASRGLIEGDGRDVMPPRDPLSKTRIGQALHIAADRILGMFARMLR